MLHIPYAGDSPQVTHTIEPEARPGEVLEDKSSNAAPYSTEEMRRMDRRVTDLAEVERKLAEILVRHR